MNSSDWVAIATGALALFTAWMVWETRKTRLETMRREREVAFRAALVELATNLQHLEGWNPSLEPTTPENWLQTPLAFAALKDLLARTWIPGVLWDRIMTVVVNLDAYVEVMTAQIRGLPPDASARGEYTAQRENIRSLYYCIDLYLKQLAAYLITEMRHQRLHLPKDWEHNRPMFSPLAWRYDVYTRAKSVSEAVYIIERGPVFPPFTPQAPEPKDPAYRHCTLERLIEAACRTSEESADLQAAPVFEAKAGIDEHTSE